MILVDTSVIVAWLDDSHDDHEGCVESLEYWAGREQLAISAVTYGELAAGRRVQQAVDEDLRPFARVELDFESAWRAGAAFASTYRSMKDRKPVLPDFLIRGQAAALGCRHLTNDRRRLAAFRDVEFLFPGDR